MADLTVVETIELAIEKLISLREGWLLDGRNLLFVTLHLTIDAQLGILSDALSVYRDPIPPFIGHEEEVIWYQLVLARAILGGDRS